MNWTISFIQGAACDALNTCPPLYNCENGQCIHKTIFPMTDREMFGSILLVFLVGMANTGGLGGAFIASPILMIIFNYDPIPAIRLVYCITFGGAIGNFINTALAKRPKSLKPLIDYDAALICMPLLMLGTNIGILLNSLLPAILTLGTIVLVMFQSLQKIYKKAKVQFAQENKEQARKAETTNLIAPIEMQEKATAQMKEYITLVNNPMSYSVMKEEKVQFPWKKYREFFLLLLAIVILFLLKGTRAFDSIIGLEYCGGGYWGLYALTLGICIAFVLRARKELAEESEIKERALISTENSREFRVTAENIDDFTKSALLGGLLAGYLGLGGGIIMNPVMMELGMPGQIATATSGLFVLFTSFISMFQTVVSGGVEWVDVLYFAPLVFIGAFGVSSILRYLVDYYKRPSIVLFVLTFVMVIGIIVIPAFALYRSVENPSLMFDFGRIC